MSTPYWWLLANLQRYPDSYIFFMTGGLGTNPLLPGTTGKLGNCTAPSNTLLRCKHYNHWVSIAHCSLECRRLPRDLLSYSDQSNIVLLSCQPLLGPVSPSLIQCTHYQSTQTSRQSPDTSHRSLLLPSIGAVPGGHHGLANSCDVIRNNILGSCQIIVVEMGSRQSHPIHSLSLA